MVYGWRKCCTNYAVEKGALLESLIELVINAITNQPTCLLVRYVSVQIRFN